MQAATLSFQPSAPPLQTSAFHFSSKQPNQLKYSLFSYTCPILKRSLLSTQTLSRKSICKPPDVATGKYVREDYLVKKVSAKDIQELIKGERNVPLIIDFYATWCGPCILMAQELEMLAVEYESNALIVKVDTDDEYEFARDMQVRGLPTLYFISPDPNKDAIRTEGLIPIQMMRDIINNDL
uniref:Thioredoxin-like protein CITRX2, chloroplastic n=1 Tax=Nicotiana benthamiana TaxID=4100 RepID=CITX2_NICBE|nr:RecName: Full=Thioredoxin-like protein CITRX2, chloroplastic; AltName: Full=Cf-9-interacting thioredoxin 2; Short=NbCiTrx2; Flags: Precursor [Nicotiana benthamiana]AAS80320.1 thioredoxin protein [Nicotiana benthamiana]